MSIYTYNSTRSLCAALGIAFTEIPELSDQVLNRFELEEQDRIPGPKHDEETKQCIANSNKEYYQTREGMKRRLLLSERNRQLKSDEMKDRWINNYEQMRSLTKNGGRRKGCKDLKKRKIRTERPVEYNGVVYETAVIAAKHHYEDNPNGTHYIRRLCRLQRSGWKYYDKSCVDNRPSHWSEKR